jgi:hypothetical protein
LNSGFTSWKDKDKNSKAESKGKELKEKKQIQSTKLAFDE